MGRFDVIESKARGWWRVVSIVIDIRNVAVVVDAELGGLQVTEGVGEVSGISGTRCSAIMSI